jgi:Ras family protein
VQYVDGHFVDSYYPTIENTFSKVIRYRNHDFAVEMIDTAGQDEYSILNSKHFIGIHGYMIVYSVGSKQSFEMVRIIRDKILNHLVRFCRTRILYKTRYSIPCARYVAPLCHQQQRHTTIPSFYPAKSSKATANKNLLSQGADTVPLTIVGNKSDLRPEQRQVTLADGKKLAEELGCGFTEASARYNENVGKAFEGMIAEIEKGQEAGQPKEGNAKCAVM